MAFSRNFYAIEGLIEYGVKLGYEVDSGDEADFASGRKNLPLQIATQKDELVNVANVVTDGESIHLIEKKGNLMLPCGNTQCVPCTRSFLLPRVSRMIEF